MAAESLPLLELDSVVASYYGLKSEKKTLQFLDEAKEFFFKKTAILVFKIKYVQLCCYPIP